MNQFPITDEFQRIAQRIIWFEPPETALAEPIRFMAYAMSYATPEDMGVILDHCGRAGLVEALDQAPPGIIDPALGRIGT